jgi:hypothetical protein
MNTQPVSAEISAPEIVTIDLPTIAQAWRDVEAAYALANSIDDRAFFSAMNRFRRVMQPVTDAAHLQAVTRG